MAAAAAAASASAFLRARTALRVVGGFRTGLAGLPRWPLIAVGLVREEGGRVSVDVSCERAPVSKADEVVTGLGMSEEVAEIGERTYWFWEAGENVEFAAEVGVSGTRREGTGGTG